MALRVGPYAAYRVPACGGGRDRILLRESSVMIPTQRWDAAAYARNARFVADYGREVALLLAARPHERILDLGCGDGALTEHLAEAASVVGVDASPELVAAARERGLDARVVDARALTFTNEFDAVFSNAALHWMGPLDAILAGVRRALRPHGRFVGEMGGHGNVASVVTALLAVLGERGIDATQRIPWTFPTADEFATLLEQNGFEIDSLELIYRPTLLPTGIEGWLDTFAGSFLEGLEPQERRAVVARVAVLLGPSLRDRSGRWVADYVRLRFSAAVREEVAHAG
jgi:trans-aconitate methyltransferase